MEAGRLKKSRGRLPLRIGVTGARGKSSVTRLLAAALREAGFKVLAKTTGSRSMLLLPDGSETELIRRARPSVLEQIGVLRKAAGLEAEVVVAELMSIRPETLAAESRRIIQPNMLLITNVRPDHTEHWGPSRETAARCLAAAIPPECTVFIPEEEMMPAWEEAAARMGSEIRRVTATLRQREGEGDSAAIERHMTDQSGRFEFESDVRLVRAVTDSLNIDHQLTVQGIRRSLPDLGRLRIWSWRPEPAGPAWDCVSAFAANDPESTRRVLEKLEDLGLVDGKPIIGLLNLRRDRGDRTLQWIQALSSGGFPDLRRLYVTGAHARAFRRRLSGQCSAPEATVLESTRPEAMMAELTETISSPALIILGMGNMGGSGRELVAYWEKMGESRVV